MEPIVLAVLGAGSVRCGVPVIASLATYFGERPLDIRFYDSDPERLDLFVRFAKLCFVSNRNFHTLTVTTDAEEAISGANRVVVCLDENSARKVVRERMGSYPSVAMKRRQVVELALEYLLERDEDKRADVLSLETEEVDVPVDFYYRLSWPEEQSEAERFALPHQIMRWVRGEEYIHEVLKEHQNSPLKAWLNDVHTATAVYADPV